MTFPSPAAGGEYPHARPAADKTGDYVTESAKMADFSALDGRYYNKVLAAYSCGVVAGDDQGRFNPKSGLTRAEACTIIRRAQVLSGQETPALPDTPAVSPAPTPTVKTGGGVSEHGKLHVQGTQLCDEHGAAVELHGMSSHGIQWFPQYTTKQAIANTAAYGANLFRVAMYTGEGGYLSSPAQIKKAAYAAMDAAIENDMYVIIDWHILSDGDPLTHLKEAQAFFQEVSARYADSPAVLYEICNEPNGGVTWKNQHQALCPGAGEDHPLQRPGQHHSDRLRDLEPGPSGPGGGPRCGDQPDVHLSLLRGHPRSLAAPAHRRRPEARAGGVRQRVGRQPGRRQRRRVHPGERDLAELSPPKRHQLGQLVPLRQKRDLRRPETGHPN